MNFRTITVTLATVAALLGSGPSLAIVAKQVSKDAAGKPVDINSAKSSELMKLPGVKAAEAAKIIAGRPYSSKADLVARNIIDAATYENLRKRIIAKQPYKDAARNAAIYAK
jgi:DNA uptake protein ComE-like DNA-binding protein